MATVHCRLSLTMGKPMIIYYLGVICSPSLFFDGITYFKNLMVSVNPCPMQRVN